MVFDSKREDQLKQIGEAKIASSFYSVDNSTQQTESILTNWAKMIKKKEDNNAEAK